MTGRGNLGVRCTGIPPNYPAAALSQIATVQLHSSLRWLGEWPCLSYPLYWARSKCARQVPGDLVRIAGEHQPIRLFRHRVGVDEHTDASIWPREI